MPSSRNAGARRSRLFAAVIALTLLIAAFTAAVAQAETITVTNTGDGGAKCPSATECTLRGAIEFAKAGDTIALGATTYTLAGEAVKIEKDLTITGAGAGSTTLTTSSASRLIEVEDTELSISGITFKNGVSVASGTQHGEGGAIYSYETILKINACTFTNDVAQHETGVSTGSSGGVGGALYNYYGRATVTGSTFEGNTAEGSSLGTEYSYGGQGGAIYNYYGQLSVVASSFSANNATGGSNATAKYDYGAYGGAIYSYEGHLAVTSSTFNGNEAHGGHTAESNGRGGFAGEGGAIYTEGSTAISSSVFTANVAGSGADASGSNYGGGGEGGAVYNDGGSLVLTSTTLSGNTAASTHNGADGGAVYSYGSVTIEGSTLSGNQSPNGYGGGIYTESGRLNLIQSTLTGNSASGSGGGGGIYSDGTAGIFESTITGNQSSGGYGGGIYAEGAELELNQSLVGPSNSAKYGGGIYNDNPLAAINTTIADNTATEYGGGIYNEEVGSLANVTLYGNAAQGANGGGNLYLESYDLALHDSLIAAGSAPNSDGNCAFSSGIIVSKGYNAEDTNQCKLEGPSDQVNVPLNLAPLGSYGGPTQTVALQAGSAAIDKGDPAGCTGVEGELLTVDQRGVTRPQNGRCDVGAFEYVFPVPTPTPTPTPSAPRDSGLSINPSSFAPTSSSASIARHHKDKAPKGATVSYNDSEAATTTFTVVRLQHGHRVHGLCKVASRHGKKSKHGKACTKETTLKGGFTHVDAAGHNQFEFTGHLGGQKLAKGTYVLIAQPRLGTLSGPRVSAVFKIS